METLISTLRNVLGTPEFYTNGQWDYGLLFEYMLGGIILCIVISSVFRLVRLLFK